MDSSKLIKLIEQTGYWNPSSDISDEDRYSLIKAHVFSQVDKTLKPKLISLLWRYSGSTKASCIEAIEDLLNPVKKSIIQKKDKSPRDNIKDRAEELSLIYINGEKELHDVILEAIDNEELSSLKADTEVIRNDLLTQGQKWIDDNIPSLYYAGNNGKDGKGHDIAVKSLRAQFTVKLKEADSSVGRFVDSTISRLSRMKARNLLTGEDHWTREAQDITDELDENNGIPASKTIDGKLIGLGSFISLVAITGSRDSFNEGVQNSVIEQNKDLVQISPELQATSCQDCINWAGTVVSLTGDTEGYPTLDEAIDDNCFHVNCIHYLIPIEE
jgi:hypothetical protein